MTPKNRRLVQDMKDAGWKFTTTSRGHLKGLAPDGETIQVLSTKDSGPRTFANQRAQFDAWKKRQVVPTQEEAPSMAVLTYTVHEQKENPDLRVCEECGATVNAKESNHRAWQVHVMAHRRNDPVTCDQCGWTGIRQVLSHHIQREHTEHSPAEKVTHHCPVCAREYKIETSFLAHVNSHVDGTTKRERTPFTRNPDGTVTCDECGRVSATTTGHNAHTRVHLRERLEQLEQLPDPVEVPVPDPVEAPTPDPVEVPDSLEQIVNDLVNLATRVEQYARQKEAQHSELKNVLRRYLEGTS